MSEIKIFGLILIFIVTIISGAYPFIKKKISSEKFDFPTGESLASGIFLGAGLIHMLGDSAQGFLEQHIDYPFAFLIAGTVFLFFLLMDHIGRTLYKKDHQASKSFAIMATIMLSIHSLFTGAALGITNTMALVVIVLIAILAHKWAASFALSIYINKSAMKFSTAMILFGIFSLMVPIGIIFGDIINTQLSKDSLLDPIFSAVASGTFLYLGTLHGLDRAVMVKNCCALRNFYFVIIGFAIMAVVAIWT
ncbi:ZIP family metal transporter [Candidiatus Paracoxiella cheracis]|uniref:ZIP family metal transporter n=1 Tax=Candidiatus Paracoxiella cheracis TaxID=3405120 RepID=UPI003BF57999